MLQALAVARGLPGGLTFANPPLYKYLLVAEYAGVYAMDPASGRSTSADEFVGQFRADPSRLYLLARATSAAIGTATILAVAALAGSVGGRRVALLSAGFAAVAYLLVRESHFGVNDALVTLLVTLGLLPCVRIAHHTSSRTEYVLAGALAGLAFAAKYHGLVLLVPFTLAHVVRRGRPSNLAVALLTCGTTAVLAFPSLLTETNRVLQDVYVHLYLGARAGYDGLDPDGGYPFYARALVLGVGAPMLLASIAALLKRTTAVVVLASVPATLLVVLGAQQMYFARFVLPALPPLIVLAALGVDALLRKHSWLGSLATLLVIAPPLADSVRFDLLLTRDDTRTLAARWIAANVPTGATVAADAPPLGPPLSTRTEAPGADALYDTPLEGVDYVVTSSFTSEAHAIDPDREVRRVAFYAQLTQSATPVAGFLPSNRELPFAYDRVYGPFDHLFEFERPGPAITIYRLGRSP